MMEPATRTLAASALATALVLLSASPLRAAVLVELFTSQGCSSCPPADRLLGGLADADLAASVVPLAFHVDYWNWIGWRDPFSDAAWSRRQRGYAGAFRSGRVYTPQAVVGGTHDCNGGDLRCIRRAVEEIASRPNGEVAIALAPAAGGELRATVTARPPAGAGPLDVMVAVYEKELETAVGRGENASKTLRNDYVVRRLERPFVLEGPARRRGEVTLTLDPAWRRDRLGVAVFLQDPRTRRVHAASSVTLPSSR